VGKLVTATDSYRAFDDGVADVLMVNRRIMVLGVLPIGRRCSVARPFETDFDATDRGETVVVVLASTDVRWPCRSLIVEDRLPTSPYQRRH